MKKIVIFLLILIANNSKIYAETKEEFCEIRKKELSEIQSKELNGNVSLEDDLIQKINELNPSLNVSKSLSRAELEEVADRMLAQKGIFDGLMKINDEYKKFTQKFINKTQIQKTLKAISDITNMVNESEPIIRKAEITNNILEVLTPEIINNLKPIAPLKGNQNAEIDIEEWTINAKLHYLKNCQIKDGCKTIESNKELDNLVNSYIFAKVTSLNGRNADEALKIKKEEEKILRMGIPDEFFQKEFFSSSHDLILAKNDLKAVSDSCDTIGVHNIDKSNACIDEIIGTEKRESIFKRIEKLNSVVEKLNANGLEREAVKLSSLIDNVEKLDKKENQESLKNSLKEANEKIGNQKEAFLKKLGCISGSLEEKSKSLSQFFPSLQKGIGNSKHDLIESLSYSLGCPNSNKASCKQISKLLSSDKNMQDIAFDEILKDLNDMSIFDKSKMLSRNDELNTVALSIKKKLADSRKKQPLSSIVNIKLFLAREVKDVCSKKEDEIKVSKIESKCLENSESMNYGLLKSVGEVLSFVDIGESLKYRSEANQACNDLYDHYLNTNSLFEYSSFYSNLCTSIFIDHNKIGDMVKYGPDGKLLSKDASEEETLNLAITGKRNKGVVKYFDSKGKVIGRYKKKSTMSNFLAALTQSSMSLMPDYLNYRSMDYGLSQTIQYGQAEQYIKAWDAHVAEYEISTGNYNNSPMFGNPIDYGSVYMRYQNGGIGLNTGFQF